MAAVAVLPLFRTHGVFPELAQEQKPLSKVQSRAVSSLVHEVAPALDHVHDGQLTQLAAPAASW